MVQLPVWLLLAECGVLRLITVLSVALVLSFAGYAANRKNKPVVGLNFFVPAYIFAVATVLLILPPAGEWVAGGWDPGVIMNQGIWVGRTGAMHPSSGILGPVFAADATGLITRELSGLREAFPGLPVDPSTGNWSFSFYRITPAWISALYSLGGLSLALRAFTILSLITVIILASGLARVVPGRGHAWVLIIAILIQPIFMYYTRTPSFEMMQLLLFATAIFWINDERHRMASLIILLTGSALIINHPSAMLFGSFLALCMSVYATSMPDNRRSYHGLFLIAGVWAGFAYVHFFAPLSLAKIGHVWPELIKAGILCQVAAIVVSTTRIQTARWNVWLLPGGMLAWVAIELWRHDSFREFGVNSVASVQMNGIVVAVAGLFVMLWMYFRRPSVRAVAAFLLIGLFVVLLRKHTADLYPWALKRVLPFMIPAVALGLLFVWEQLSKRRHGLVAAIVFLIACTAINFNMMRHALKNVELSGLTARLADIAALIPPDAVVVTDHFRWGTPLAALHGLHVINGERIWTAKSDLHTQRAMKLVLENIPPETPVYWVTVTDRGLDLYSGLSHEGISQIKQFDPVPLRETLQHARNRSFKETRVKNVYFSVHTETVKTGE